MPRSVFGSLAKLRETPVPDQTQMRERKQGYRSHPLDLKSAANDEELIELRLFGLAGKNFYSSRRNAPHYHPIPGSIAGLWGRIGIGNRLLEVDHRLSEAGLRLWLLDAWRPTAVQAYFHDRWMPDRLRAARPHLSKVDIQAEVETYWAAPTSDLGGPSPHSTGGAIDVSLCWLDDHSPLWMGSLFDDVTEVSHRDYYEREPGSALSVSVHEARANRRLLHWAMTDAGFCGHPDEWWHFSYGDQMWARLTDVPFAFYGPTEPTSEIKQSEAAE